MGGSYKLPNLVIYNINNKKGFKTIVHEIIHLLIENQIQEFKIQHWEKERIVDLILNSDEFSFLEYNNSKDESACGVENKPGCVVLGFSVSAIYLKHCILLCI